MSQKSKSAAKLKRRKDKRARKDAQKAEYANYRDQGINQKSKRFRRNQKRIVGGKNHADGPCGNVGCQRCHPRLVATTVRAQTGDAPRVMGGQYWCDIDKPKRAVEVLRVLPGHKRNRHALVKRFDGRSDTLKGPFKVRLDKFGTKYARIMAGSA